MKFMNKIIKFMYGRYGIDDLYYFLLKLYLLLFIFDIFLNNMILSILEIIVFLVMFYRLFSKNISVRYKENQQFLKVKRKLLKPLKNIKRNIYDKDHIYKKCHKCKTILKLPLPNKRGFKRAKCPECGNKVILYALKYQKVEVIYK